MLTYGVLENPTSCNSRILRAVVVLMYAEWSWRVKVYVPAAATWRHVMRHDGCGLQRVP